MDRHEIADILNHIGLLLELKGESFFKSKAYYEAARAVELLDEDMESLIRENRLKEKKGFGDALTKKLTELVETGRLEYYERLKQSIPSGLIDILRIPGLGPKKVKAIYEILKISSVAELKQACLENRLAGLQGFGERTQQKICEGIENLNRYSGHSLFYRAELPAVRLVSDLEASGLVNRCSVAGSLRRKKETVKDIDILASSQDAAAVMAFFTKHRLVENVAATGDTKTSVVLREGINADLRVVEDREYPYALHHFTGSREHNTAMRHLARKHGIKMNEYGLFKDGENISCSSEEEIFSELGMAYIPPELRENNGEIEAALKGEIPVLVEPDDLKGVFHVHTSYSDGLNSIEDMVKACMERGYSYLGVSDHSRSAVYAGGLEREDILRQHEEIDMLNEKYKNFRVLKGIELDILPDGSLDYDGELLSLFDFTIASVHSAFRMDEDKMTKRIIKAMSSKHVNILGHPAGRLLLTREGYKLDMGRVLEAAAREGVALEINADPHRLDLDWRLIKPAKDMGCRFVLSPDAHSTGGLDYMGFGLNIARKGWLTASDIANTYDAGGALSFIGKN